MLLRTFFLLFPAFAFAQHIQGTLTDAQSDFPLTGATIEVIGIDPVLGTTTDLDGRCSLGPVPTGRLTVRISSLGYATQTVPNVLVTAGKDVMLDLALEESVTELAAVTVTAGSEGRARGERNVDALHPELYCRAGQPLCRRAQ